MSVLIKGMEMPKTHPLTVTIYPDGQVLSETVGAKDKHGIAVPVPPHGRLIDADALKETIGALIKKHLHGYTKSTWDFVCELRSIISDAPIIIPSEPCKKKGE